MYVMQEKQGKMKHSKSLSYSDGYLVYYCKISSKSRPYV